MQPFKVKLETEFYCVRKYYQEPDHDASYDISDARCVLFAVWRMCPDRAACRMS